MHRLSNIDAKNRIAICSSCGKVRVTRKLSSFRCGVASYQGDVRRKYGGLAARRPDCCEVCGSANRVVYDHSHTTGHFRGWLCNACNVALGLVGDDPARLIALAEYLNKRKTTL